VGSVIGRTELDRGERRLAAHARQATKVPTQHVGARTLTLKATNWRRNFRASANQTAPVPRPAVLAGIAGRRAEPAAIAGTARPHTLSAAAMPSSEKPRAHWRD